MIPGFFAAGAMGGRRLWTPSDLSVPPDIWVDWDSAVTNVAGNASQWSNSKGSIGGSFGQSTGGARPSIQSSGLGGRRFLRFDGTNDCMHMTSVAARDIFRNTGQGWLFSVIRKRGTDLTGADRVSFYAPSADGASRFHSSVGTTANENAHNLQVRRLDADSTSMLNGPALPGEWVIRRDIVDWANGEGFIHINGELEAQNLSFTSSGNTSNSAGFNQTVSIAATYVPVAFADIDAGCYIAGAGSFPAGGDWERLEGWAAWQCGLMGNLPISHPYKDAPPYV